VRPGRGLSADLSASDKEAKEYIGEKCELPSSRFGRGMVSPC
jgi:hypothetical protein